jgi:hypothetical protein
MTDTIQFTDLLIDAWNIESLDDDKYRFDANGGENHRFNMGDKYLIGGLLDQVAYSLNSKLTYLNTVQHRHNDEVERNGPDSNGAIRTASDLVKAEAAVENCQMLFTTFVDLYEAITQGIWCDGTFYEDHGRAWWAEEREKMRTPKNEYVAPTKKQLKDRKAMLKQRLHDRQTQAAVA